MSAPSINEPRFISESYFLDFKFEPGNGLSRRQGDARRQGSPEDRLPAEQVVRRRRFRQRRGDREAARATNERAKDNDKEKDKAGEKAKEKPKTEGAGEGTRPGEGQAVRGRHPAQDGQDLAGHAVGRSGDASDRQVHLRQRLAGLPAGRAGSCSVDDLRAYDADGPAVSRACGCRATSTIHAGVTLALGPMELAIHARVLQLPQGRRRRRRSRVPKQRAR